MGYENRDYARDDIRRAGWSPAGNSGGGLSNAPVWQKILIANIVVFLLQIFFTRPVNISDFENAKGDLQPNAEEIQYVLDSGRTISIVQEWLELDSQKVLRGQIWRVVTCGFCHDRFGIWHILMNMLFLFWFGGRLEERYGSQEFAVFYFCSLLASSFAYIALDLYTNTLIPAIGASGAVWGIVALYALLYPYDRIYIYFLFPVPIWLMAVVYFAFDLHPVLLSLSGQEYSTGVAHAAHVGGAVFGFLYFRNGWQLALMFERIIGRKPKFANSRSNRRQTIPMFGPYKNKSETPTDDRMDKILEKISAQGRDSLTEEEEQYLVAASARMRDRK